MLGCLFLVIYALPVSGGLFDDEKTERTARLVMALSVGTAVFLLIQTIISIVQIPIIYEEAEIEGDSTFAIVSVIGAQILVCMIPVCGYMGSKNSDSNQLCCATVWNAICAIFSFWAILISFVQVTGYEASTCDSLSADFDGGFVAACWINTVINILLVPMFAVTAYFANQLLNVVRPTMLVQQPMVYGQQQVMVQVPQKQMVQMPPQGYQSSIPVATQQASQDAKV